jgi:hypothetical protein
MACAAWAVLASLEKRYEATGFGAQTLCCGGNFEMVCAKLEALPESAKSRVLVLNRLINRYCAASSHASRKGPRSAPVRTRMK